MPNPPKKIISNANDSDSFNELKHRQNYCHIRTGAFTYAMVHLVSRATTFLKTAPATVAGAALSRSRKRSQPFLASKYHLRPCLRSLEQAAAFDAACIGKTATEIASLMGNDGKGNADVQAAGCTIYVTGFVKAATKI